MNTSASQLRRYLLGDLPAGEASELDTQLFADDQLRVDLEQEQESLIDDFLAGTLTAGEDTEFRQQIERSPRLQEAVRSARIFVAALESETTGPWQRLLAVFTAPPIWLTPALASLLCVAAWLVAHEFKANAALKASMEASRQAPKSQSQQPGSVPLTFAFLSSTVARGATTEPELNITEVNALVEFQLELRGMPTDATTWDAELKHSGTIVWKGEMLPVHTIGQERFLALFVDAKSLQPGEYEVHFGPSSGDSRFIQSRTFRVTRH